MPVFQYTLRGRCICKLSLLALLPMLAVGGCALSQYAEFAPSDKSTSNAASGDKSTFTADTVQHLSDGDSMTLHHLGKVRLAGVDCPELHQKGGTAAAAFTRNRLKDQTVQIEICKEDPKDMYGRRLVFLYYTDKTGKRQMLNTALLREGYARVYKNTPCLTGRREAWEADYEFARQHQRGLFASEGEVPDGKIYRRQHSR